MNKENLLFLPLLSYINKPIDSLNNELPNSIDKPIYKVYVETP